MDQTFLSLISLIIQLTNEVAALQKENAVLKSGLPVQELTDTEFAQAVHNGAS